MRTFSTVKPYSRNRASPSADAPNRSQNVEQRRVWFDFHLLVMSVVSDAEVLHRVAPLYRGRTIGRGGRIHGLAQLSSIWTRTTIGNGR
jgi:hypothetical protein